MNTDQAKALAKAHGPAAGVAAVVATIAVLATRPDDVKIAPTVSETAIAVDAKVKTAPSHRSHEGQETRLVSCGKAPRVTGDDSAGTITLGDDAEGRCTLLFAAPLEKSVTCAVTPGRAAKLTATDLVLEAINGPTVTYRCGVAKP